MNPCAKTFAAVAASLSLLLTPTMAAASSPTATPTQSINPLAVVSLFGSRASAAVTYPQVAPVASAAHLAVMAQASSATDPDARHSPDYGINWPLLALGTFFFLAGVYTLFADDDDDGPHVPISPD
ncbi:hypothetical protein [Sphingomonas alba]|uniref:Transmembrane protein n=1 Tax=Sphingomonas alba TaxID=2908208 RepID=A0ABT0RJB3_9SPHN|nr:hypothetical protein [Sphingomonas alba]MCL6682672.1 hypothetical protein [Sphingomonas alba]